MYIFLQAIMRGEQLERPVVQLLVNLILLFKNLILLTSFDILFLI